MSTTAGQVSETPSSIWEDFFDIWYAPAEVFRRRTDGKFGPQLLILTLATLALFLATKPALDPIYETMAQQQIRAAMEQNPQLTQEQVEQGQGIASVFQVIAVTLATPISVVLLGIVIWLVGKMFDAQLSLRTGFVIATMAYVPRLLEWVVNAVQAALMDPAILESLAQLSIGPARFLDADATALVMTAALRLSLFVLWSTVLIAIGLRVAGKLSMGKAAAAAAVVWLLGAIPAYLQAMQMT